jgi:hypothetical protein
MRSERLQRCSSLAKFVIVERKADLRYPHIRAGLSIPQTTFAPIEVFFSNKLGMNCILRAVIRVGQLKHLPWAQCIYGRKIKNVETQILLRLQFIV